MSNRIVRLENGSDRSCAQSALNSEDNIYYNIIINNNTNEPMPAVYSERKVQSILEHPEQYYLSLIRFNLSGQSIPIFVFQPDTYYVTLSYLGVNYSQVVLYQNIGLPNQNAVYSYEHMIDMINIAFKSAFNAIPIKPAGIVDPPFITYDAKTLLFTLRTQTQYAGTNTIEIWMNNILYFLFDNFNMQYGGQNNLNHKDFRFIIQDLITNRETISYNGITPAIPYYFFNQEYVALFNWASFKTITFKSATLPIRPEYIPSAKDDGVINVNPIMVDFELDPEQSPALYRTTLNYTPTAQYRLVDLTGRSPVSDIQVAVTYKDNNLKEYPIYIPAKKSLSIKLAFVKKDLYKKFNNLLC